MSANKNWLAKLELIKSSKAVFCVSDGETKEWLEKVIKNINDGTYVSEPWEIRPVSPNSTPSKAWLHETLNEAAERKNRDDQSS